eukprot:COSAG05_NODE_365_length_10774_cov_121.347822_2_plen_154_part_00
MGTVEVELRASTDVTGHGPVIGKLRIQAQFARRFSVGETAAALQHSKARDPHHPFWTSAGGRVGGEGASPTPKVGRVSALSPTSQAMAATMLTAAGAQDSVTGGQCAPAIMPLSTRACSEAASHPCTRLRFTYCLGISVVCAECITYTYWVMS